MNEALTEQRAEVSESVKWKLVDVVPLISSTGTGNRVLNPLVHRATVRVHPVLCLSLCCRRPPGPVSTAPLTTSMLHIAALTWDVMRLVTKLRAIKDMV